MPPRRTVSRAGFATVVFGLLLSVGLGYAAAATDREGVPLFDAGGRVADAVGAGVAWVVPDGVADALFGLLPGWFGYPELGAVVALAVTLVLWAAAEARWAGWTVEAAVDWVAALRPGDRRNE
ncbi:hypothetical protein [Halostella litorea]|uniref:hypothetical protein n=1 Tax=Halostella litorea TaxID=2528831 RepID=UPI0010921E0B|nr:hypothetical protein [Halostella litorea]